ncbi:MAG: hypothetical protein HOV66_11790, partial [Streptomycetaceae bacterium]|nr:hypothetical protein [Streptomycetaceae bacterium]
GNALAGLGTRLVAPGTVLLAGGAACAAVVGVVTAGSPELRNATLRSAPEAEPEHGHAPEAEPGKHGAPEPADIPESVSGAVPEPVSRTERQDPDDRHQPV